MTTLREAAQQALDALEEINLLSIGENAIFLPAEIDEAMDVLKAALAEPDLSHCPQCGGPADNGHDRSIPPSPYWCTKCMAEPVQEPYDQTSLELCNVCGWKTLIPGDCCLNCERKHPLGQASTDVPLTVYSVKKAHEP